MRKSPRVRRIGALAVVAALAVPAAASAHPSVLQGNAKVVDSAGPPVTVRDEIQYLVANHGFPFVFKESNGVVVADRGGVLSYKLLPSAYRRQLTRAQILSEGDTGVQAHATCRGVAALSDTDNVYSWQGTDPFYDYIPFQDASAGLEDDPATWIPVVRTLVGVDLTGLDAAAARTACEGRGGTYTPADTIVTRPESLASAAIAEATDPLETQIDELTRAKATLEAAVTALTGEKDALTGLLAAARAEVATLTAALTPLDATLAPRSVAAAKAAAHGVAVDISGPPARTVKVRLVIGALRAKALGLKSGVLASGKVTLGADGAAGATLKPGKAAAGALKSLRKGLAITLEARSGDRFASARGTLTK